MRIASDRTKSEGYDRPFRGGMQLIVFEVNKQHADIGCSHRRRDVRVEAEEVRWIVLVLEGDKPLVVGAVRGPDPILALLPQVVDVLPAHRELLHDQRRVQKLAGGSEVEHPVIESAINRNSRVAEGAEVMVTGCPATVSFTISCQVRIWMG